MSAFSPTRIYGPYEERFQREEHDRSMRWVRSSWMSSVEDVIFEHEHLGVAAIPFSGDHKPVTPREGS